MDLADFLYSTEQDKILQLQAADQNDRPIVP